MPRRKSAFAAALVLSGGVALALLFHKPSRPATSGSASAPDAIRHRVEDGPRYLMEVRSAPAPESAGPAELRGATRREDPIGQIGGLRLFEAGDASFPRIASDYPTAPQAAPIAASGQTRHRIVDGDTLESLAQRYLGDASRAAEIFAANRDVLTSPELLPIDAALKIPVR